MRQVVIALTLWFCSGAGQVRGEPVRAAYPSPNVQFLPAFVSLEKGFYKREGLEGGAYLRAGGGDRGAGADRRSDPVYHDHRSADAGGLGGGGYHPARAAGGTSDFFAGGQARDPESRRSQGKEARGELRRLHGCRDEGAVGSQQDQPG